MGAALQRPQVEHYQLLGTGDGRPRYQSMGTLDDKISDLPNECIGLVIEYAFPDSQWRRRSDGSGRYDSWLGGLLLVGCVNRSFLEALKYISTLRVGNLTNGPSARALIDNPIPFHSPYAPRRTMDARFDGHVQRWCDIARRRLGGVLRMSSGSSRVLGPDQTRMIVDLAASFPCLEELELDEVDPVVFCEQVRAHLRAGRLSGLRSLVFEWNDSTYSFSRATRREVKSNIRDLMSELPVDRAMDLLLRGLYPRLLVNPGQWGPRLGGDELAEIRETARVGQEEWAGVLLELLSRGADIRSRPILYEVLYLVTEEFELLANYNVPLLFSDAQLGCLADSLEVLITRGADPHLCPADMGCTVLYHVLDELDFLLYNNEGDSRLAPLFRFLMRAIDLLVRHGATSFNDTFVEKELCQLVRVAGADGVPFYRLEMGENALRAYDPSNPRGPVTVGFLHDWIRARPDCTPPIRDALRR